jgi:alanine-glyoxylate transaminase/serine-glyoxylate transaminase/serine-pyruvate transaminase
MNTHLVGYLDPEWLALLDEMKSLLRQAFLTQNNLTFPLSGTGSSGMEAAIVNFLEPGEKILVGCNGYFSERLCDMARLHGGEVIRLEKPWGEVFTPGEIKESLQKAGKVKLVALVHGETSTGALQPLEEMAAIVHDQGALLVVDAVTTLGGVPIKVDEWGLDVVYSASQKCLGCPPGLAPITVSNAAREVLTRRKTPIRNWYLDLTLLEKYWNEERIYHHTPSTTLHYGLREGLKLALEEGLEERWLRHETNAQYLWTKLENMCLDLYVKKNCRLAPLTTVRIPPTVEDQTVRRKLLADYNIDISGGFGPLKGKIWRIGLMGFSSRRENITMLTEALREVLHD